MPHWDFKCANCGETLDLHFPSYSKMKLFEESKPKCSTTCGGSLERQTAASAFEVKGFNEENGYASPRTIHKRFGNIKTTVTGNPEILRDEK